MTTTPTRALPVTAALLLLAVSTALAQSMAAGTAKNVVGGALLVVRADGVETRLRGRGTLRVFEGDTLKMEGKGKALIETDEGTQLALNGDSVVQIQSRWEKDAGVTRIVRMQRGEVWAKIGDSRRGLEIETPVGVLAARAAEINVRLVSDNEAVATVVTGVGEFSTPSAACELRAGTMSFGHRSQACTPPAATDVRTVIGWSRPLLP